MNQPGFFFTSVKKLLNWAQANSLWYTEINTGCCANEVMSAYGARYDIERFGCVPQLEPRHADLLFINGAISYKLAPELRALYLEMTSPKYVIAVGSCASCGGAFASDLSYCVVPGVDRIIPVDVYVPGCPPRPEAIMNGLLALQDKISGNQRPHQKI